MPCELINRRFVAHAVNSLTKYTGPEALPGVARTKKPNVSREVGPPMRRLKAFDNAVRGSPKGERGDTLREMRGALGCASHHSIVTYHREPTKMWSSYNNVVHRCSHNDSFACLNTPCPQSNGRFREIPLVFSLHGGCINKIGISFADAYLGLSAYPPS